MKTKLKQAPILLATIIIILFAALISYIGYLSVGVTTEALHKRRLSDGVQIMARVAGREDHLQPLEGDGLRSYTIDYEFQYTDRQTGELKKQKQTSYVLYKKEFLAYAPGATFTASFIPVEPSINAPTATIGRFSPRAILLARLLTGLVFVALAVVSMARASRLFDRISGSRKSVAAIGVLSTALIVGLIVGGGMAHLLERLLLG